MIAGLIGVKGASVGAFDNIYRCWHILAGMDAIPVLASKAHYAGGYIMEMVVWRVPTPIPGSTHFYKYRMFYGRHSTRIVSYDNERSKGDHKHLGGVELPYKFVGVDELIRDFLADVEQWRLR